MKAALILSFVLVIQVWEIKSSLVSIPLPGGACLGFCSLLMSFMGACRPECVGKGIGGPSPPTASPPTASPPTASLPSCQTFHCSSKCNQSSGRTFSSMCEYRLGSTITTGTGRTCAIIGTKCCSVYPAPANCQTPARVCNTKNFNICTF